MTQNLIVWLTQSLRGKKLERLWINAVILQSSQGSCLEVSFFNKYPENSRKTTTLTRNTVVVGAPQVATIAQVDTDGAKS